MKKLFTAALILSFCALASHSALAADLAPEAQNAMDKGLAAANQQDWELAIKYFSETQQASPLYFPAYFNLGLAHQNAGHELPAICWFRAYLQHVPNDKNKKAIQKEITNLEVAVESKIRKILKQALDIAQTLPDEQGNTALGWVFKYYAESGLTSEAVAEITPLFGQDWSSKSDYTEDYARRLYAFQLVKEGDLDQAVQMGQSLTPFSKNEVLGQAVLSLLPDKDLPKVLEYVSQMPEPEKWYGLPDVAKALGENGRTMEAKAFLEKYSDNKDDRKIQTAAKLAKFLAEKGQIEEAQNFAALAQSLYEEYRSGQSDFYRIVDTTALLCEAFSEKGDIKKAESWLGRIHENSSHRYAIGTAYAKVAWAKLRANDRAGFERTAQSMPVLNSWDDPDSTYNRDQFYSELCALADEAGEKALLDEFYDKIKDVYFKQQTLRLLAYRYYKAGLLDEAEGMLLRDEAAWDNMVVQLLIDSTGFDLAKAFILKGEKERAAAFLDKMLGTADMIKNLDYLEKMAALYAQAGQTQKAAEIRKKAADTQKYRTDLGWVNWAKYFEKQTNTYNPEAAFKRIQSSQVLAGKLDQNLFIPGNVAGIASDYAAGLRSIARWESELARNRAKS